MAHKRWKVDFVVAGLALALLPHTAFAQFADYRVAQPAAQTAPFVLESSRAMTDSDAPGIPLAGTTNPLLFTKIRTLEEGHLFFQWQGETGTPYILSAANFLGVPEYFYPLYTGITSGAYVVGFTNGIDPSPKKYYRVDTRNDTGVALLLSDIHLNPYVSTSVVSQLVAADYTEWHDILVPFTNDLLFAPSEWGEHATSYALFNSALENAAAAMPSPDLILFPGDYPVHDFREHYTAYTGDATTTGYRDFMYKLFAFVGDEIHRRYPSVPLLTTLGNNDTYLTDYELAPEGAFLTDAAGLLFTNGMSNACIWAEMASDFQKGGYYSIEIGSTAQVIGLTTAFLSTRYTNEAGFVAYDPATNALHFVDMELAACEAAGKPVWVLLHILPGVNAYETCEAWGGEGSLTNAVEFWQNEYLDEFIRILAAHGDTVRAIFCGHTHMREFRLASDPATSMVTASILVTPGIDYTHGNNPAFQIMTYDRSTFDVESVVTYALSRSKYEGKTGPAAWDLTFSYNDAFSVTNFAAAEMERLYADLTNSPAAAETYGVIYETGSGGIQITPGNWPVYSAAIRWLSETQFLDHAP